MLENYVRLIVTDKNVSKISTSDIRDWRRQNPNGKVLIYLNNRPKSIMPLAFHADRIWRNGKLIKSRDEDIGTHIRFLESDA